MKSNRMNRALVWAVFVLATFLSVQNAYTQEDSDTKAAESAPKKTSGTVEVKAAPIKITVDTAGHFESDESAEIELDLKAWAPTELEIESVIEHGAKVRKGQVLIAFDREDYNKALTDAEENLVLAELELKLAVREFEALKKSVPLDLEAAERAKKVSHEDRAYFHKVRKPVAIDEAKYAVVRAERRLEYELEELNQLKKMYEADDLTEETEEIILMRQQHVVEGARRMLEDTRRSTKQTLEVSLPRQTIAIDDAAERAAITLATSKAKLPAQLDEKEIALHKQERALDTKRKDFEDLKKDAKQLALKAPMSGIVYFGEGEKGQFKTAGAMKEQLKAGEKIKPGGKLMTIIQPDELIVRISVPEDKRRWVKAGTPATVTPTIDPNHPLRGEVRSVDRLPSAPGMYDAVVVIEGGDRASVMPGMGCKVSVIAYQKEEAIVVARDSVFSEDDDPAAHFVYLKTDAGCEKRKVKLGARAGSDIEVLDGVEPGDVVFKTKPEDA